MTGLIKGTIKALEVSDEKWQMEKLTRRFKLLSHKYSPDMRYAVNVMDFGLNVIDLAEREFFNLNVRGKLYGGRNNWAHFGWTFVDDDEIMIVTIKDKLFEIHNVKISFEHELTQCTRTDPQAFIKETRTLTSSESIDNIRFHVTPVRVEDKDYLLALVNKDSKPQLILCPTNKKGGHLVEVSIPDQFIKDDMEFSFNNRSFFVQDSVLLSVKNKSDQQDCLLKFDISKLDISNQEATHALTSDDIVSIEQFPELLKLDAYFLENYFQFEQFLVLRRKSTLYVADLTKLTLQQIDPQTKHSCFFSVFRGLLIRWDYAAKMNLDRECCCPCCDRDYAKGVVGYKKWPLEEQEYIKKVHIKTPITYWVYPVRLEDEIDVTARESVIKTIFGSESDSADRGFALSYLYGATYISEVAKEIAESDMMIENAFAS